MDEGSDCQMKSPGVALVDTTLAGSHYNLRWSGPLSQALLVRAGKRYEIVLMMDFEITFMKNNFRVFFCHFSISLAQV